MPASVRLDQETENLLLKTAQAFNVTKAEILKASIRNFCKQKLQEKSKKPYDLIVDLIGIESSGQGNLAIDSEKLLRKAFRKTK